jgi:hypothetical protein
MAESFSTTHEKVQFFWQEGCRIAKEKKDYIAAIELIIRALNIVKKRPPRRAETKPISNGCPSTFFEYTFAIKGGAK